MIRRATALGAHAAARLCALPAGFPTQIWALVTLFSGQLAAKVIGFATYAVLARRLSSADYGAVEYVVGLAAFFSMAIDCGLGTIAVRRIGASPSETSTLAVRIPTARLLIAVVAAPLMVAVMAWHAPTDAASALTMWFAASLLLVPWNSEWLLQARGRMGAVAATQIVRATVFAVGVLFLVRGRLDVAAVGLAEMIAVVVVSALYVLIQALTIAPLGLSRDWRALTDLTRAGVSVGLAQFMWSAAQYLPLFLVGRVVGGEDVGWFGAAQRVMLSVSALSMVYHFNLFPALARAAAEGDAALARLLQQSFRVTAWVSIGATLGLALGARGVMVFAFGERFAQGAPSLAIMIWVIPVTILSGHARWALIAKGEQASVLYAQLAGLVTVLAGGVILVRTMGANGAALAAVVASIAVWCVAHIRLLRVASLSVVQPTFRPALVAVALWYGARLLPVGPTVSATLGVTLYFAMALLIDRRLWSDAVGMAWTRVPVANTTRTPE